jgi:DNA-binding GntR family transcriptional regulator
MTAVKRKVLRDNVYDILLDRLLSGMYQPGQPLSIDQIARDLGVSPTPLREALAELEHTGLIKRAALKGYRVADPLSAEQIAQIVDVRILLEVAAAERAFDDIDRLLPDLQTAFETHRKISESLRGKKGKELDYATLRPYFDADWAFHQVILDHCGNPYLERAVDDLAFNVHRMRQTMGLGVTDSAEALEEHRAIIKAYDVRSPVKVRSAVEAHLRGVLDRTLAGQ